MEYDHRIVFNLGSINMPTFFFRNVGSFWKRRKHGEGGGQRLF